MASSPFDRLGRALRRFWEELTSDVTPAPSPSDEYEPPANRDDFDSDFTHGPYRKGWGALEKRFWDTEPNTYRQLYSSEDEWLRLQTAFHEGWIASDMSFHQHEAARQRYYRISGTTSASFDWEAFREYWAQRGSP
jgi:hypothetical protein